MNFLCYDAESRNNNKFLKTVNEMLENLYSPISHHKKY